VHVRDDLYSLGEEAYVLALPHTYDFRSDAPGAPFVTMLYWAPSLGAAQRAALNRVDLDDLAQGPVPDHFGVELGEVTYGSLRVSPRQRKSGLRERATYDASGRFVHKVIDLGDRQLLFRDLEISEAERAYAIAIVLPD
jgi:hypothetical protein